MLTEAALVAAGLLAAPGPQSAQEDLSRYAPEGTLLWLQTSDLTPVLEEGLEHPLVARVLGHPLVQADLEAQGQDPAAALAVVEALLGRSPLELAADLASGGLGVALLGWNGGAPRVLIVLRGEDADTSEEALETLVAAAEPFGAARQLSEGRRDGLGERVLDAWDVGDEGAVLARLVDGAVVLASTIDDLRACARSEGGPAELRASRRELGAGTFAWLDLDALEERGRLGELRGAASQPGPHFVLGPVLTYATRARSLGAALDVDGNGLELRTRLVGHEPGRGAATFPAREARAHAAPPRGAREVGRAILHRDVATLLAQRAELFAPRAQPGIAEGLANLALLVGGADAVDELFASLEPDLLLLAEEVTFDEGAVPDVALPAVCVVARVANPEVNGARVVGGFQSLVALTNVQRAQNGEPGLVLGLEQVEGATLSLARFAPPADGDGVDVAYNLAPACVLLGDTIVLGTHHALVRSLVERLGAQDAAPLERDRVDDVIVRAPPIADLITRNRDLLVMQAVLEDGKPQERAAAEVALLHELVGAVDSVQFTTAATAAPGGVLTATLRVALAR